MSTLGFVPPVEKAYAVGNTYYVRADGTVLAADKANATSPNAAGASLSMAQMKLATFAAGDQVLFSSQGGNYTEVLNTPSSGSGVGNEITYANVLNESPVITLSVGKMIQTGTRTYIIVKGFTCIYTGTEASNFGILLGAGSYVTLQNISVNMGGYGYGVYSSAVLSDITFDNITVTNVTSYLQGINLSGVTNTNITVQNSAINSGAPSLQINNATRPIITNTSTTGLISIITGSNITVSNIPSCGGLSLSSATTASITNVNTGTVISKIAVTTGSNITVSSIPATAGVTFSGVTTGTISNITATSTGGTATSLTLSNSSGITVNNYSYSGPSYAYDLVGTTTNSVINGLTANNSNNGARIEGTANNITINDSTITNSLGYGAFDVDSGAHDITFNRDTVLNSHSGFVARGTSYNVTYNNCTADNNTNLGFLASISASNIVYWRSEASYNGTVNATSDGGGFLPHNSAAAVKCYYCIAHHNYNEGFGDVSDGAGNIIYNSISWSNGYGLGDTYKGVVVTTPSVRGNNYWGRPGGNLIVNNGIFGGNGKPREVYDTYPGNTTRDYNLYKPLDDNKFYNTADNGNNTSWTTYHLTNELNSANTDPLFVNTTGNYTSPTDFLLSYLSPAIDTGTTIAGVTTDYAGNPIYGVFDKGAYEYQPPHTMGTNGIDIGAGARIYGDGKFRDLNATSGSTADLSIAPSGGSFPAYGPNDIRPAWLDASIATWNNTGTHHKNWTESSAVGGLNNTLHSVGDLESGKYYNVKVDNVLGANITGANCTSGLCLATGGTIAFTYTGGYSSSRTFDVEGALITITASAGAHGAIDPTGAVSKDYGSSQTFTITADIHYHIADVLVDSVSQGAITTYDFTNITTTHTIFATFTIDTYTITYSAGANGSIVGTSPQTVDYGASGAEVTATPVVGYHFVSWSDSVLTAARTDANVTADITVTATFAAPAVTHSSKKKAVSEVNPSTTPVSNEVLTPESIVAEITQTLHNYNISAPTASFTVSSDNITGSTVTFDASGSTSNKGIVKYEWDFGDWEKAEGMKVEHKYQSPGRYTVTLTVTDRAGNKNTTTKTIDIKPAAPTISNITAKGTALWIEGKSDPGTTIYFTIHSNPFEGQGLANKDGYWTYYLDKASEVIGEGDHTIVALAAVKLADNSEIRGAESKTYDFKMSVDNGKLKVEMQKVRVWQIVAGVFGLIIVLIVIIWALKRRRRV